MKNFTTVKALALSLLFVLPATVAAKRHHDDADHQESYRDDCDGCGNPLRCGCFNVEVKAGLAPTVWSGRGCFLLASNTPYLCNLLCQVDGGPSEVNQSKQAQLTPIGALPKFRCLYKLPYWVGGKIGYAICDCVETYLEFNYRAANNKCFCLCWTGTNTLSTGKNLIQFDSEKYRAFDGHVGARYYSERHWCDTLAFFVGIKVGFAHYKEIDANIRESQLLGTTVTSQDYNCVPLYCSATVISAGGHIGFDYCFCNNWSFVFTAEFLGTGPLLANPNLGSKCCPDASCCEGVCCPTQSCCSSSCDTDCCIIAPTEAQFPTTCTAVPVIGQAATTNIVGANFKSQVVFPITFGLKYSF